MGGVKGRAGARNGASVQGCEGSLAHARRVAEKHVDWNACRSCRRMLISLNEAGAETMAFALAVGLFLYLDMPEHDAIQSVQLDKSGYETIVSLSGIAGEGRVCDLIRALVDQDSVPILTGALAFDYASQAERSPRSAPLRILLG